MLKNYLKTAIRHLLRNRFHSFLTISGLAIGMAVAVLIGLWINDECSYEQYNPGYDHIARVMQHQDLNGAPYTTRAVPVPLAAALRSSYGNACPQIVLSQWTQDHILSYGDKKLTRKGKFMEAGGPDLLGLTMLKGSGSGLSGTASVLLSATAARSLFGDTDPMGKVIRIDDQAVAAVTGVYADIPANSQFHPVQFIAPWKLYASVHSWVKEEENDWSYDAVEVFVRLNDNVDAASLSAQIKDLSIAHLQDNKLGLAYHPQLFLQPMADWRLYSEQRGQDSGGLIRFVWLFGAIGAFVLLLACINFMNLSTARSERRAREVGIRKAMGSMRVQLIAQFLGESVVTAFVAFLFALLLVMLALPAFNRLADKDISIGWSHPRFWLTGLSFSLLTGVFAGSYPALYLSRFRPVKVLKGLFRADSGAAGARRALVVLQFTVSMLLIVGTVVVFRQVQYAKDRPTGYDRSGLLTLPMNTSTHFEKQDLLREELLQTGAVREVAASSSSATTLMLSLSGFEWRGKDPNLLGEFGVISVTHGYGKAMGWEFTAGRDLSRTFATDSSAMVINEAAAAFMGLKNPVGETITWDGKTYHIIGVIHNMIIESPYERVRPTIYYPGDRKEAGWLFVKLNPAMPVSEALAKVQSVFHRIIPSAPFDYTFVADEYGKKFATEERIGQIGGLFTVLAIFISCLGIFGMASFMAERRTREIGVRKVLGASVLSLWQLLSKEFVLLVGLSVAIATPVAYLLLHRWLQQYTFHSGIPWWIFAGAGLGVLLITLFTVSVQSVKAAMANPVKSLRSE